MHAYFCRYRTIGDRIGEAKAHGNIGNTLKVLDVYDDAMTHCEQHLSLTRQLHDKVSLHFMPFLGLSIADCPFLAS